jgi:hypothetical protein
MAAHPITIYLPEEVYESYQKTADTRNLTLEEVITEALREHSPASDDAELTSLKNMSDDALWLWVNQTLSAPQKLRLDELTAKNKSAVGLTSLENDELELLLTQIDTNMLARSRALVVLRDRGHDVSRFFGKSGE